MKTLKIFSGTAALAAAFYTAMLICFYAALPCNITAEKDAALSGRFSAAVLGSADGKGAYFLGGLPIKYTNVNYEERPFAVLGGEPFGIKIRSDGVMVISAENGSPAQKAGMRPGDVISEVNGQKVCSNGEIAQAVQLSPDSTEIVLSRADAEISLELTPVCDGGIYKIGAWVRDSAAGIGTLTFALPESGIFGGLGHSVSDVTTGGSVPLGSGEITEARIYDVIKGKEGSAGELCGVILPERELGEITANTETGLFGKLAEKPDGKTAPVAFKQEVHTGGASILTTVEGSEPREYAIEIERINLLDLSGSKAMVIRITDGELLEKTGGIVRGMSGSPILQDGKLCGAVTHVLVNDPTRGYAVFVQTMLENCGVLD